MEEERERRRDSCGFMPTRKRCGHVTLQRGLNIKGLHCGGGEEEGGGKLEERCGAFGLFVKANVGVKHSLVVLRLFLLFLSHLSVLSSITG